MPSIISSTQRGFTLIELIVVIVAVGILAAVAIPGYQDLGYQSKVNSCRNSLMSLREAIGDWQAHNIVQHGLNTWPPIDTLATVGRVMAYQIPPNPFQVKDHASDSIVTGVTKGVIVGTRGGWAYKASTGEIWANTGSTVPASGCSGGTVSVGENTW